MSRQRELGKWQYQGFIMIRLCHWVEFSQRVTWRRSCIYLLTQCLLSACMLEIHPRIRQRPGFYGTYILVWKEGVTLFMLCFSRSTYDQEGIHHNWFDDFRKIQDYLTALGKHLLKHKIVPGAWNQMCGKQWFHPHKSYIRRQDRHGSAELLHNVILARGEGQDVQDGLGLGFQSTDWGAL